MALTLKKREREFDPWDDVEVRAFKFESIILGDNDGRCRCELSAIEQTIVFKSDLGALWIISDI